MYSVDDIPLVLCPEADMPFSRGDYAHVQCLNTSVLQAPWALPHAYQPPRWLAPDHLLLFASGYGDVFNITDIFEWTNRWRRVRVASFSVQQRIEELDVMKDMLR